jgi:hypothetical protein
MNLVYDPRLPSLTGLDRGSKEAGAKSCPLFTLLKSGFSLIGSDCNVERHGNFVPVIHHFSFG